MIWLTGDWPDYVLEKSAIGCPTQQCLNWYRESDEGFTAPMEKPASNRETEVQSEASCHEAVCKEAALSWGYIWG